MKSRIIIIVLSVIIILQMTAGIFFVRRNFCHTRPMAPYSFLQDGMRMSKWGMKSGKFGPFSHHDFMKRKLSLNDDQEKKIDELNKIFEAEFTNYMKVVEPERDKLKEMLDNNVEDINIIKAQLVKMEAINTEIHLLRIKQGIEISKILTKEQMDVLKKERKRMFEKMKSGEKK